MDHGRSRWLGRLVCGQSLRAFRGPQVADELRPYLAHRDPEVVKAAATILRRQGPLVPDEEIALAMAELNSGSSTDKSLAPLQTTANSGANRRVQQAAVQAYQSISNRLPRTRPKSRKR
jgi:hypothetical protein